ncbi:MAG: adenosine-specific kinase [Candidatus Omnitrophica bacterium]|nr:adenosine-specific kinase [Candidatus Omnitrophota bacterium]MBU4478179.1 adenosine-specific kinase [Candidatus Omnitrophota bacterium]MCG2703825.1 adenosine-specific kinase [Candidatus Omnitrophota bacterium]
MEIKVVKINIPKDANVIIGQAHFIKTVEDIYETLVGAVPGISFGVGFCEASGACLVRGEGNDAELKSAAQETALAIGAGHCFVLFMRNAFPINVMKALKDVPEICAVFCATANPLEVLVAEIAQGRGVVGVIDGASPKGIEKEADIKWRKDLLRKLKYKL